MFLNSSITGLIDQDVNYYGFLESKEYSDWIKSIEGQTVPMDIYYSPYFGMQSSGVYRELDNVYEDYRQSVKSSLSIEKDPTRVVKTGTTGGVNTALILAAAAFFFAG